VYCPAIRLLAFLKGIAARAESHSSDRSYAGSGKDVFSSKNSVANFFCESENPHVEQEDFFMAYRARKPDREFSVLSSSPWTHAESTALHRKRCRFLALFFHEFENHFRRILRSRHR